jgi:hypothetical protein
MLVTAKRLMPNGRVDANSDRCLYHQPLGQEEMIASLVLRDGRIVESVYASSDTAGMVPIVIRVQVPGDPGLFDVYEPGYANGPARRAFYYHRRTEGIGPAHGGAP